MTEDIILGVMGIMIPLSAIVGGFAVALVKIRHRQQLELARLQHEQGDPLFALGAISEAHDLAARVERLEAAVDRMAQAVEAQARALGGVSDTGVPTGQPRRSERSLGSVDDEPDGLERRLTIG